MDSTAADGRRLDAGAGRAEVRDEPRAASQAAAYFGIWLRSFDARAGASVCKLETQVRDLVGGPRPGVRGERKRRGSGEIANRAVGGARLRGKDSAAVLSGAEKIRVASPGRLGRRRRAAGESGRARGDVVSGDGIRTTGHGGVA